MEGTVLAVPTLTTTPIVSVSDMFPSPLVYVIPLIPDSNPLAVELKSVTCDAVMLTAVSSAAVINPFAFTVKFGIVAALPKLPTFAFTESRTNGIVAVLPAP